MTPHHISSHHFTKHVIQLWKIGDYDANLKFLVDLSDHQSTVNVVRFSPCGKMIATASDRQIIIYSLPTNNPTTADGNSSTTNTNTNTTNSASVTAAATAPAAPSWGALTDPKMVTRLWLRPCLQEIYDLQWSPDSLYIIAGSIDSKVMHCTIMHCTVLYL